MTRSAKQFFTAASFAGLMLLVLFETTSTQPALHRVDDGYMVLSEGFANTVTIHIPDTTCGAPATMYVPVYASNISFSDSVIAYQMIINYDSAFGVFDSALVEGCITPEFFYPIWNFTQPGVINGGYANFSSLEPIAGEGVLCYLRFTSFDTVGLMEVTFEDFIFNEGDPAAETYDATIEILGDPVGVETGDGEFIPNEYKLLPCYPNPFNSQTVITFQMLEAGMVNLTLYDIQGKQAAVLYSGAADIGRHSVRFQAGDFASGIYFVKFAAAGYTETGKIVLIK